ncbi:MAG: NAD-dependent epimerase/dehydratase family protein [Bacilli bacterium]
MINQVAYVTGGTGHLGRNLIMALLEEEEDVFVVALVLKKDTHRDFGKLQERILFIDGDISNPESIDEFLSAKSDCKARRVLYHAAGKISILKKKDPLVFTINVDGTRNMLEGALRHSIDKFIYVSSVDAIDKPEKPDKVVEEDRFSPEKIEGVYGQSKAMASNLVLDYARKGLDVSIVQPTAIMGPGDVFGGPINTAIRKYLNHHLKVAVKGGYDIVDVRDVAKGMILASKKGRNGKCYILSGTYVSVLGLLEIAHQFSGVKKTRATIPHFIVKMVSPILELHARIHHKKPLFTGFSMDCLNENSNYSCERAQKDLGYQRRPLEETMKDTVGWMYKEGLAMKD